MKFKIGDKIRIRKDSSYYGTSDLDNPSDIVGTITTLYDANKANMNGYHHVKAYMLHAKREVNIGITSDHCYFVAWCNGGHNVYREEDLEVYKQYETAIASVL